MPPLATRLRHLRRRLPFAALVLSALAFGGAPRGHAQTSASTGSATVAPAPTCSSDTGQSSPQSAQDILDGFAQQDPASAGAYATTAAYVAQFYPPVVHVLPVARWLEQADRP